MRRSTAILAAAGVLASACASVVGANVAQATSEQWYGTVEWQAGGTKTLIDGSVYSSNEIYKFTALEVGTPGISGTQGKIEYKIRTSIRHPDPLPGADNCWLAKETYSAFGLYVGVPGEISVEGYGAGNARYLIQIDSTETGTGAYEATWAGGVVDGQACSSLSTSGDFQVSPWVRIYSADNYKPAYRAGKNKTPDRTYGGGCGLECTEGYQSGNFTPAFTSQWALAAKECSGFSKSYSLGNGDYAFVFNPCQTKSLSARVNFLDNLAGEPRVCKFALIGKKSAPCRAYKTVRKVQWTRVDWFMFDSAYQSDCGVWVVNRSRLRPTTIQAATRFSDGLGVSSISPGTSVRIRSHNNSGFTTVSCP